MANDYTILTEIPDIFLNRIQNGSSFVDGVSIRNATNGQYEGFLQQSSCHVRHLTEAQESYIHFSRLENRMLNIENIFSSNLTEQTARLNKIQDSLSTLNIITGVGAAAAIVNIGVAIGGFTIINKKLKNIENKIDSLMYKLYQIENKIELTNRFLKIINESKLHTALERLEDSFQLSKEEQKIRYWQECERDLNISSNIFFRESNCFGNYLDSLISNPDSYKDTFTRDYSYDYNSVENLLLFPTTALQARAEALMLLQEPQASRSLYFKLSQFVGNISFDKYDAYLQRRKIVTTISDSEKISEDVRKTSELLETMKTVYKSKVNFLDFLIDKKIDSRQFIEQVRATKYPTILFLPVDYKPISVTKSKEIKSEPVIETELKENSNLKQKENIFRRLLNFLILIVDKMKFWK